MALSMLNGDSFGSVRGRFNQTTINLILHQRSQEVFLQNLSTERRFRPRISPLDFMTPAEIKRRYRFDPETIYYIANKLYHLLKPQTLRSNPIPPLIQVLIGLDTIAHGAYYHHTADFYKVCKATVERVVKKFCRAVHVGLRKELKWPTKEAAVDIKESFYRIAGMPNVIALADGMLVKIRKPTHRPQDFMNRKNFYSINCLVCAGPDNMIYFASAHWPGSVNDSRALDGSPVRLMLERETTGYILGDNGFSLRCWLMTPILNPQDRPRLRYNSAHCRTRVRIEHTFGILKAR